MTSLIAQYFLNHRLEPNEIEWQLEEIARQGYEGIYAHARTGMLTPYFSDAWWRVLDKMIEVCKRTGLEFYLWDDDYFPSGLGGGRVVWTDPGLAARDLRFHIAEVSGAGPFEVDFEPGMLVGAYAIPVQWEGPLAPTLLDLTPFCGTRKQRWAWRSLLHRAYSPGVNPAAHPHWRSQMAENRFAVVWTPAQPGDYTIVGVTEGVCSDDHPDLLRPDGIRLFLELTHEEYRRRYGDELGGVIKGSFTDEPSPGALLFPWSPAFPTEFERDHGYDLRGHLPHLALDLDERSALVRHHYRETQHRLVKANYVDQVTTWCHEHNLKHIGHLTRTEWLSLVAAWWPNELRCYESMDIPCADPLGATCGFKDAASYHTGLKVVASAARLFGKAQAGADCLAVAGDEASLRDLKYLFDYHLAMGLNHFTVHGLSYSNDGPRKDEVPPSLGYQHTEWEYMRVLLDHVRENAAALTGGRHVCGIAMLYPSTSLYCRQKLGDEWMNLPDEAQIHRLVEELLCRQKDFDFVDEQWLAEAYPPAPSLGKEGESGLVTGEGLAVIILPYLRHLTAKAAEALQAFAAAGGRVLCVGSVPLALTDDLDAPVAEGAETVAEYAEGPADEWLDTLPGVTVAGEGARDVFVLRREREGVDILFAFNRREATFSGIVEGVPVTIAARSSVRIENGEVVSGQWPGGLGSPPSAEATDLSTGWTIAFAQNHLPLSFWHCTAPGGLMGSSFNSGQGFDLMRREPDPQAGGEGLATYSCRFMLTGEIPDAKLVIDDSGITGDWTVYVNDRPVTGWARSRELDCLNRHAPIGHLLRSGTSPLLNVVRVETTGPGRGLQEVMYLYGSFTCQYRYGHLSYPFAQGGACVTAPTLQPWAGLGYPTFSGSAVYRRRFSVRTPGDYLLDLGRVEDVAAVTVDGEPVAVVAWEPYRMVLPGLTAGAHELAIKITNAPANRNRAAGLPAGLLGPVRLAKVAN